MACQGATLRAVCFFCCLLLASYQSLAQESLSSTQDHAIISNQIPVHHSPDHPPSTMNYNLDNEKTKLPVLRNRRDLNSNQNRQSYNRDGNRALHSAFRYNDEIMRLLQSHSPKPYTSPRSEFFYNILRPLDRRTVRYSNWDDHSVMHFGKRSIPEEELAKQKEQEEGKDSMGKVSKRSSPWSDHSVMHFGKRSDDDVDSDYSGKPPEIQRNETDSEEDTNQGNEQELNYYDQRDIDKKDNDPWHNMMSFGKRDDSFWGDHNTMHFGKRDDDPWHSMMSFGKRDDNDPWHSVMSFGKRDANDPWHSVMSFGKRDANDPWHNVMSFGKRDSNDPWHNVMSFGKRDANDPWHNVMSFGKRDANDPWHSVMSFGKRDANDPWHNVMSFGKRDNNDPWHNVMSFGKRDANDPWHNVMSFGKKSENLPEDIQIDESLNLKNKQHIDNSRETVSIPEKVTIKQKRSISDEQGQTEVVPAKRYDIFKDHSTMHFGKKSDPWESHNTLHFGKKNDPWESHTMHFGKKSDPWDSHNTMHFGKKSDPWDSHNTMHFGKKSDPWESQTLHFGKKSDPWDSHNTMHFGKKSDPWDSHNTMHFGKKSDPWDSHNTMHFGKKSDPWELHNTMHFGKRSEVSQDINIKDHEESTQHEKNADNTIKSQKSDGNDMNIKKRSANEKVKNFKSMENANSRIDPNKLNRKKRSLIMESADTLNTRHNSNKLFDTKSDNQKKITNTNENKSIAVPHLGDDKTKQRAKSGDEKSTVIPVTKRSLEDTEKISENYITSPIINEENLLEEPQTDSVLHFGKRSIDDNEFENSKAMDNHWVKEEIPLTKKSENLWETHNTMHFGKKSDPWDSHNTMHFGKKSDPWDYHNTMHFGKKSDPWDSHNTMHFGKKSDPWDSHNTMHFGKKSDPWDSHNTMHFGKKSDPWDSHNTMHFGKKNDPWESQTLHFGKKSDPWESHNTMHFGKKSDPWDSHNTMHFGKKSDPWDSHNTMHFGKRWGNQSAMNIGFASDLDSLNEGSDLLTAFPVLNYLNDYENSQESQLKWKSYLALLLMKLKEGSLTNSDLEPLKEYLLSLLLRERVSPEPTTNKEQLLEILDQFPDFDSGEGPDEEALNRILHQLSSTEFETQPDDEVSEEDVANMDDEMPQSVPNLPLNYDIQQNLPMKSVNKRYWAPFQGPRSIVYPHAWFASQIRRSVLPTTGLDSSSRIFETRMAEKKEDPVNSFMHFGKR